MKTRLIIHDADELNVILESAFSNISNPLNADQSVWDTLQKALTEAYALGSTKAALLVRDPMPIFRAA